MIHDTPTLSKNVDENITTDTISLGLVIDTSGSMSPSKKDLIIDSKAAIDGQVNSLKNGDSLSITNFTTTAKTPFPLQQLESDRNFETATQVINDLVFSGGTNINSGILEGIQQLVDQTNARAMMVFSDGDNNTKYNPINFPKQPYPIYALQTDKTTSSKSVANMKSIASNSHLGEYYACPQPYDIAIAMGQIKSKNRFITQIENQKITIQGLDSYLTKKYITTDRKELQFTVSWEHSEKLNPMDITIDLYDPNGNSYPITHSGEGFKVIDVMNPVNGYWYFQVEKQIRIYQ